MRIRICYSGGEHSGSFGRGDACSALIVIYLAKKSLLVLDANITALPQFKGFITFGQRLFISMFYQGGLSNG